MTRYWLTVHWPKPVEGGIKWNIFLRTQLATDRSPAEGDRVLFYVTGSVDGKPRHDVKRIADGVRVPLDPVRGKLHCAARATGGIVNRPPGEIRYDYEAGGHPSGWKYEVRCEGHERATRDVSPADIKSKIKRGVRIRGGLTEISADDYQTLRKAMGLPPDIP